MKEQLFEMGSLPPNPRDFPLSRQDSGPQERDHSLSRNPGR